MSKYFCKQTEGLQKAHKTTRGWPPKRRREQALRIHKLKPWLCSTGPRTAAGKKKCRMNARTHGNRSYGWRQLRHALQLQRRFMKNYMELHYYSKHPRRLKARYYAQKTLSLPLRGFPLPSGRGSEGEGITLSPQFTNGRAKLLERLFQSL